MDRRLLVILSALGLCVPACGGNADEAESQGAAISAEVQGMVDAYLASAAFAALAPEVGDDVKALLAQPDQFSHIVFARLNIVKSDGFVALEKVKSSDGTLVGRAAQRTIVAWILRTDSDNLLRILLGEVQKPGRDNADAVRSMLQTMGEQIRRSAGSLGTSGGGTGGSGGTSGQTPRAGTSASLLSVPNGAAATILAEMFTNVDVGVSQSMVRDWQQLRSRYQTSMAKAARSAEVQSALRDARHIGSETLAKRNDSRAQQKFDQASLMVDQFVKGKIQFSIEAMNTVHAVVAHEQRGVLRNAEQNVWRGDDQDRFYLPGQDVEAAVSAVFKEVRARASKSPAPELAAVFDQRMISIHPYMDGNGRTTRLMTDWLLARDGYPPIVVTQDTSSAALFWQKADMDSLASARITDGMRRTVELLEGIV